MSTLGGWLEDGQLKHVQLENISLRNRFCDLIEINRRLLPEVNSKRRIVIGAYSLFYVDYDLETDTHLYAINDAWGWLNAARYKTVHGCNRLYYGCLYCLWRLGLLDHQIGHVPSWRDIKAVKWMQRKVNTWRCS